MKLTLAQLKRNLAVMQSQNRLFLQKEGFEPANGEGGKGKVSASKKETKKDGSRPETRNPNNYIEQPTEEERLIEEAYKKLAEEMARAEEEERKKQEALAAARKAGEEATEEEEEKVGSEESSESEGEDLESLVINTSASSHLSRTLPKPPRSSRSA